MFVSSLIFFQQADKEHTQYKVCFMVLEKDFGFNSVSNWLKRRQNLRVLEAGCFQPQMETEEWRSAWSAEEQCRG